MTFFRIFPLLADFLNQEVEASLKLRTFLSTEHRLKFITHNKDDVSCGITATIKLNRKTDELLHLSSYDSALSGIQQFDWQPQLPPHQVWATNFSWQCLYVLAANLRRVLRWKRSRKEGRKEEKQERSQHSSIFSPPVLASFELKRQTSGNF